MNSVSTSRTPLLAASVCAARTDPTGTVDDCRDALLDSRRNLQLYYSWMFGNEEGHRCMGALGIDRRCDRGGRPLRRTRRPRWLPIRLWVRHRGHGLCAWILGQRLPPSPSRDVAAGGRRVDRSAVRRLDEPGLHSWHEMEQEPG